MMLSKWKKTLSVLTAAVMIVSGLTLSGFGSTDASNTAAAEEPEGQLYVFRSIEDRNYMTPAERFSGGSGTEESPYEISNAAELAFLSELINGEYSPERTAYQQASYVLTADIVLNDVSGYGDWAANAPACAWKPIGVKNPFQGVFDGNNHKIIGMYVSEDVNDRDDYNTSYGLFGENEGTIRNLSVISSYLCVSGYTANIGGIAGQNAVDGARIENCRVEAAINCYRASCGGIAGNNRGTVSGCVFSGSIHALQEEADPKIGGLAGYNSGSILSCRNEGSIVSGDNSRASAGGIVGSHHGGSIAGSVNEGKVSGAHNAGGIAGTAFLSNIGGKFKSTSCEIVNCSNHGSVVTKADAAGGIVGDATNDHSAYTLLISDCENSAAVQSLRKTGGIAGTVTASGAVSFSGCNNTADLSAETAGGIIASASYNYGSLVVSDSENSGVISASLYAAGIIAENNVLGLYLSNHPSLTIAVTHCSNTGAITTARCGGGILGAVVCPLERSLCEKITFTLENDSHHADLNCNSFNAFAGGIAGNLGIPYAQTHISGCTAEGTVSFADIPADEELLKMESGRLEYARMAGGVVGRIGTGLYLSTLGDKKTDEAVNAPDAKIRFDHCSSSVRFNAPEESKYTYEIDGAPVFLNRFGGIIGYYSGEEGYSFSVTECSYTNVDRGLGDRELSDVGTGT